jgi:hypothetical protein
MPRASAPALAFAEPTPHADPPEMISADHRRLDEPRRAARSGTKPDASEDGLDGSTRGISHITIIDIKGAALSKRNRH